MKCREYKYISLGGSCIAMPLLGDLRIKGPIDNMKANMGLESCLSLFNDFEFFKSNLLQNTTIQKIMSPYSDLTTEVELSKGIDKIYNSKYYTVFHNIINDKFLIELEKRYNTFKHYTNSFDHNVKFIYFINSNDSVEEINKVLKILKNFFIFPIIINNNSKKFRTRITKNDFYNINTNLKLDFDCLEIETEQENKKVADICHLKFENDLSKLLDRELH